MPTYVYRCKECGKHFEQLMTISEHEKQRKPQCPKCSTRKVEQLPAGFQAVTGKKS